MTSEWVDLTQPFDENAPHSAALPAPEFETLHDVAEEGVNAQWLGTPTHVGTHVDAPRHMVDGGATIDDLPLSRFAGEGVVLDVRRDEPEPISVTDIEAAERETSAAGVRPDDIVVLRTGWGDRYGADGYERYPWLADDVGEWLLERGIKLLAVDTPSPDRPRAMRPDGWDAYPIHRALLPAGVPIAEHLSIPAALTGTRPEVFGFPLRLRGGDGAPARFVARPD
ncbi:cyclase family protein [Halorientalis marina]|uniref:cyclase family protein n=1 Tax=Halorientalis marina TaxID=2931976 RepID=UPI001FF57636|nr:cyclase family protein [Halorientalis marina]